MEIETEVKTYRVELQCDECGDKMESTGTALYTSPPQYPHKCKSCGCIRNIRAKEYPYMKHVAS